MKLLPILLIPFLTVNAYCQIQGSIKDINGKKISAAIVIARDSATGKIDSAKIVKPGLYCFYEMKPGIYSLEISAAVYESQTIRNIIITAEDKGATNEEPDLYYGKRIDVILKPAKK
jgi:hypothetical protein